MYTVRTPGMDFEIEGKELFIGDQVAFRIAKDGAYVRQGDKEDKYIPLVGQQARDREAEPPRWQSDAALAISAVIALNNVKPVAVGAFTS